MSKDIHSHFSRLMLSGMIPKGVDQFEKTGLTRKIGRKNNFVESEVVGQSALAAWEAADKWIAAARNTQLSCNTVFKEVNS